MQTSKASHAERTTPKRSHRGGSFISTSPLKAGRQLLPQVSPLGNGGECRWLLFHRGCSLQSGKSCSPTQACQRARICSRIKRRRFRSRRRLQRRALNQAENLEASATQPRCPRLGGWSDPPDRPDTRAAMHHGAMQFEDGRASL